METNTMALSDLTTDELARRLGKLKFGVGDPLKANQLIRAAADRLAALAHPNIVHSFDAEHMAATLKSKAPLQTVTTTKQKSVKAA
jgi:hypothetical protein